MTRPFRWLDARHRPTPFRRLHQATVLNIFFANCHHPPGSQGPQVGGGAACEVHCEVRGDIERYRSCLESLLRLAVFCSFPKPFSPPRKGLSGGAVGSAGRSRFSPPPPWWPGSKRLLLALIIGYGTSRLAVRGRPSRHRHNDAGVLRRQDAEGKEQIQSARRRPQCHRNGNGNGRRDGSEKCPAQRADENWCARTLPRSDDRAGVRSTRCRRDVDREQRLQPAQRAEQVSTCADAPARFSWCNAALQSGRRRERHVWVRAYAAKRQRRKVGQSPINVIKTLLRCNVECVVRPASSSTTRLGVAAQVACQL